MAIPFLVRFPKSEREKVHVKPQKDTYIKKPKVHDRERSSNVTEEGFQDGPFHFLILFAVTKRKKRAFHMVLYNYQCVYCKTYNAVLISNRLCPA